MIIFGLLIFFTMLVWAGMSMDIAHHEEERALVQATLDRSVLAAASLNQAGGEAEAKSIVRDYFVKSGVNARLSSTRANIALNSREVSACASGRTNTVFMRLVGVPSLPVSACSTAREATQDIEVALVLDVSGSMVQAPNASRLPNLKTAANAFVDTVLANDTEQRVSIAIVPFNGQVNLGPTLASKFTFTADGTTGALYGSNYNFLNCFDLPPDAYLVGSTTANLRRTPLATTGLGNSWDLSYGVRDDDRNGVAESASSGWDNTYSPASENEAIAHNMWCPYQTQSGTSTAGNIVRPPTNRIADLKGTINGLVGVGATSINAGMRWGLALLDPTAQPMFAELASANAIPTAFRNRPFGYRQDNALKVVVLMTDGEHFPEQRINAGFRSGTSPIWRASDDRYSIFHAARLSSTNSTERCKPFWVPHKSAWYSRPWNGNESNLPSCYSATASYGTSVVQQSWPQVWFSVRMSWVAHHLYARAGYLSTSTSPSVSGTVLSRYNAQMALLRSQTDIWGSTPTMDAQLQTMCNVARDRGIIVYGIAFEVDNPSRGYTAISNCATSIAHFRQAEGLDIVTVFRSIAAQINALKLTR